MPMLGFMGGSDMGSRFEVEGVPLVYRRSEHGMHLWSGARGDRFVAVTFVEGSVPYPWVVRYRDGDVAATGTSDSLEDAVNRATAAHDVEAGEGWKGVG